MVQAPGWLRREVDAICDRPLPLAELAGEVAARLHRAVPHDGYCLFGFDPLTGGTSFHTSRGGYADRLRDCSQLSHNEMLEDDLHRFADLVRAQLPVGVLGGGHPDERRSRRRHEIMPEAGLAGEMRVALRTGQTLWGALVLVREPGRRRFTDAEASQAGGLTTTLARAVRRLPVSEPVTTYGAPSPGVILIDGDGAVEAISPEAHAWLARIAPPRADLRGAVLPPVVWQVAIAARRALREPAAPEPTCRVRALEGDWLVLHASAIDRDPAGRVAVVLHAGDPGVLRPALTAWYGLSEREQEVVALVLDGRSTRDVAAALGLSRHTVHDHLKAIFRKVGVSGRHELVAALRG